MDTATVPSVPKFSVSTNALIIGFFSVVSRILGLLRDRLLASHFGAGDVLDAYYAAFKLPDFIFNIFILGALSSAFIPVFIEARKHQGESMAWQITNTVLNFLLLVMSILCLLSIIFAPLFVPVLTPGFSLAKQALTINLTRLMMVAIIFLAVSNLFGAVLNSYKRFIAYGLAPVLYNIGIILGLFILVPFFGPSGLAGGVLLGAILHTACQLPTIRRLGWRWGLKFFLADYYFQKIIRLMIPRTLGLAVYSINQLVITYFASLLASGSLAAFVLATNLQSFPINVFGVSLAIAVFPIFSESFANNKKQELIEHLANSLKRVLFFTIPLSVLFLVLRAQVVRIILGSGNFDWGDTINTANVFAFLSLSLVAESLLPLIARAFYAQHDTKTPVMVSILSVFLNLTLATFLIKPLGISGLAIAYVSSTIINFLILTYLLSKRLSYMNAKSIVNSGWQMLQASLLAGMVCYGILHLLAPLVDMHSFAGIFIQGVSAGLAGLLTYLFVAHKLKIQEVCFVKKYLNLILAKLKLA